MCPKDLGESLQEIRYRTGQIWLQDHRGRFAWLVWKMREKKGWVAQVHLCTFPGSFFKDEREQLVTIFCIMAFHVFEDSLKHCSLYSKLNSTCYDSFLTVFFFLNTFNRLFLIWETQKNSTLNSRISQLWHYWRSGLENTLLRGPACAG